MFFAAYALNSVFALCQKKTHTYLEIVHLGHEDMKVLAFGHFFIK